MEKQRGDSPNGSAFRGPTGISAEAVAWWLLSGEADPALLNSFFVKNYIYGVPDEIRRRAYVSAQVSRIIAAAQAAGISDVLANILADLFRESGCQTGCPLAGADVSRAGSHCSAYPGRHAGCPATSDAAPQPRLPRHGEE